MKRFFVLVIGILGGVLIGFLIWDRTSVRERPNRYLPILRMPIWSGCLLTVNGS